MHKRKFNNGLLHPVYPLPDPAIGRFDITHAILNHVVYETITNQVHVLLFKLIIQYNFVHLGRFHIFRAPAVNRDKRPVAKEYIMEVCQDNIFDSAGNRHIHGTIKGV